MNEALNEKYGAAIRRAEQAGDVEAARSLEQDLAKLQTGEASPMAKIGAGMQDVITAGKRWAGSATKEDTAEQNKYAEMADPKGWGRLVGQALPLALTAMVPGANTVAGAAAMGAGTGAFMNPDDALKQGAIGGATGGILQKGFNVLPKALQGAKEQVAKRTPMMAGTKQEMAERAFLESIPADRRAAALTETYAYQPPKNMPGFNQTTAAVTRDPTLLAVERQLREAGGEFGAPLRATTDEQARAVGSAWEREFGGTAAADARRAAGDFAEQAKQTMPLNMNRLTKPDAFMPVFKDISARIQTSSGGVRRTLEKLQDELYQAVQAAQKTGSIEPLHQFRMTSLDDAISVMNREGANKQAKVLRQAMGASGIEGVFDAEMNRMTGNKWGQFLTGYSKRAGEAGQREAGQEWLTRLEARPQTSSGEPMASGLRQKLRTEIAGGMVDDYGKPAYTPSGTDLLKTTSAELERAAAPYAPDVGPRGSATAENLRGVNDVINEATGAQKAAQNFSAGEIGTGTLGSFIVGNPAPAIATLIKHYGFDPMKAKATADIARRMVQLYADPQAAADVLNRSMLPPAQKAMAKQLAEDAIRYLPNVGAVAITNPQ